VPPSTQRNATVCLPSTTSKTITSIGAMLDGPFTDAAVTAGGRTCRAHRVMLAMLAAASPVFLSMLDGPMREARESAVELVGVDAGVVELLLRHLYGGTIEVPVSAALQLYALADKYQAAAGLQQRLRVWLMVLQPAPEVLCELVPAARALCRPAYERSFCDKACDVLDELSPLAAFAAWPADAVVEVMGSSKPLPAFNAAVAWMEAEPRRAKKRCVWPRLLDAVPWDEASTSDLLAIQQHPRAGQVPGLERRQVKILLRLCEGLMAKNEVLQKEIEQLQQRMQQQQQQQQQHRQRAQPQQEQQLQQEQGQQQEQQPQQEQVRAVRRRRQ
jgi:hypothetical protein